jgi:hypothetical protein
VDSDPVYDKIMSTLNDRDCEEMKALDEKIIESRKHNWVQEVNFINKKKRFGIEDAVEKERKVAERITNFKFV